MICTIEGDKIKCVVDAANIVYKDNTPENRVVLGLEEVRSPRTVKIVEKGDE